MPYLQPLWASLAVAELVPTPGFTAKLASVLSGDSDAALYLPVERRPTYIWDYTATALLLAEAGGTLTTLEVSGSWISCPSSRTMDGVRPPTSSTLPCRTRSWLR